MTCASAMLANYRAPYTATVVQRLVDKGECLLLFPSLFFLLIQVDVWWERPTWTSSRWARRMRTATSVRPRIRARRPPKSTAISSWRAVRRAGCAVAVSEGFADVAIGSDTGGSTRNPASFNGVCGFKPSYGLLSRHGLVPLVNSFDAPSLFTRTVDECIKYFDFLLGQDARLHDIVDVSLPHTPYSVVCYHVLNQSDVFSNMSRYEGMEFGHREDQLKSFNELLTNSRTKSLNDVVRKRIFAGNFFNLEENKGQYFLQAAKNQNEDFFTQSANMCGLPAISLPFGHCSNGLPLGVQLIGDYLDDWKCLELGRLFHATKL
ncbi:Glutamyl-tRNA(Gln) amidotransferase subunit A, mitochondrial [Aphelenchoides fujianensis]|nr:Glutamyl-tRNA(Gln) amidotransferase subunit A, mitochondrial [Aphelenchoides fujianensis]